MGALYREEVECYDKSIFKGVITFLGVIFATLVLFFIFDLMLIGDYFDFVLIVSIITLIGVAIKLKRKVTRVYRYEIIDKEIIIEDVTRGRRKVKLNFNAKHIVTLGEQGVKYINGKPVVREYKFMCNTKSKNTKRCIFEKNGKLYSLRFEPSDALITKIEALRPKVNI